MIEPHEHDFWLTLGGDFRCTFPGCGATKQPPVQQSDSTGENADA